MSSRGLLERPGCAKVNKRVPLTLGGSGWTKTRMSQMDYSSQVVDPTSAHDYAGYEEGFAGYDQIEEEAMFYQPQEEAEDEEEAENEEVAEDDDVEVDYLTTNDIVPEPQPEPRRRRRAPLIPLCLVVGPPFPGGPETTLLLSDCAKHATIPLWVKHHNVSV